MKKVALKLIRFYQKTLSPDHGPLSFLYSESFCRFRPTCSEYTYQAIDRYGLIVGGLIGFWRINRCHPFAKGGIDLPPNPPYMKRPALWGLFLLVLYIIVLYFLAFSLGSLL